MFDDEVHEESPTWLVTFADAMSLLLTFFVLLISFSSFDNDAVHKSMVSVSDHLGGGSKRGDKVTKASINLAEELAEIADQRKSLVISETAIKFKVKQKPINVNVNDYQKTNAIKELLKRNPALIRMLINKKSPPGIKINQYDKALKEAEDSNFSYNALELSLQNLEHYIISEGLDSFMDIEIKDNGEISFEIDCIAIFNKGTVEFNEQSKRLLARIAAILKKIPNKVALENFGDNVFNASISDNQAIDIALKRSLALLKFITSIEPDVGEDRFAIIARGMSNERLSRLEKLNKSKEGVIGITILAYGDSMY